MEEKVEAMTAMVKTGGLDVCGEAAMEEETQTGSNPNPNPNPNPNKRAIAIATEEGEKKPKTKAAAAAEEEVSSYYDDPNPYPGGLDLENSTIIYNSDGESLSSSDSNPLYNYKVSAAAAAGVQQKTVVSGNDLGLVRNEVKLLIPCDICKRRTHVTAGCPCLWQIPDPENPPEVDEDKYCITCSCGMVLIDRKCTRDGCRASWPDQVVPREDCRAWLAFLESKKKSNLQL